MLIHEIHEDLVNKIQVDHYNRVSGVFLVDKPTGITSHDVVDDFRHILRTRKVGHAGALDPFASGLLIILVGKYTKYTDVLISQDKTYTAEVLLGISTTTQDPEGDVVETKSVEATDMKDLAGIQTKLQKAFQPSYLQTVPIFSSVKVDGNKLRVLARSAESYKKLADGKVIFKMPQGDVIVDLPSKQVEISRLELQKIDEYAEVELQGKVYNGKFASINMMVNCSKGTYIRQLAEDVGVELGYPACLVQLRRETIAGFSVSNSVDVSDLVASAHKAGVQTKELSELRLSMLSAQSHEDQ